MSPQHNPACPGQIELDEYICGTLDSAGLRRIAQHVEECSSCRRAVEEIRRNRAFEEEVQCVLEETEVELKGASSNAVTFTMDSGVVQDSGPVAMPPNTSPTMTMEPNSREVAGGESVRPVTPVGYTMTMDSGSGTGGSRPSDEESLPVIQGYDILREINRGGQGVVYEGIQKSTGRTVAVKAMLNRYMMDERLKWRFEQEVRLIAGIKHANIVTIYDSGTEEGLHYYVMEFVNGEPLDTYIRLKSPSIRDSVKLFIQVCEGVAVAHRHGVIHRDLKPSNILVDSNGVPQVLDFGLAKVAGEKSRTDHGKAVTQEGQVMGTLRYMSPEQTLGDPDAVDSATDIYSLGVILYEILAGKTPYKTDTSDFYESLGNIREKYPARPSTIRQDIDRDLEAIVLRALEKDPVRRYHSVSEFQSDLMAWVEGRAVIARSASSFYLLRKMATKNKFQASVIALLLISVTSFAIIGLQGVLYGRHEATLRADADSAYKIERGLNRNAEIAMLREMSLGWLLWHYEKGNLGQARLIRDRIAADSPERLAADYLLDPEFTEQQLAGKLSANEIKPLLNFVLGERAVADGDRDRAIDCFRECQKSAESLGQTIWEERARTRMQQLSVRSDISGMLSGEGDA